MGNEQDRDLPEVEDRGAVERLSDLARDLGHLPVDRLRELLTVIEGEEIEVKEDNSPGEQSGEA